MNIKAKNFNFSFLFFQILVVASYFIVGKIGLEFATVSANVSAVWPTSGLSLALFLIYGRRVLPGIFVGAFLVNITTAGNFMTSFGIAIGNTLEAFVGGYLVNRFAGGINAFEKTPSILKFVLLAGMLATAISASIGVISLILGDFLNSDYLAVWLTWWLGDLSGVIVIAPLVIVWATLGREDFFRRETFLKTAALFGGVLVVGYVIFGGILPQPYNNYPAAYLAFPILIWASLYFGRREALTAVFLLNVIAIIGTFNNVDSSVLRSQNQSLIILQGFIVIASLTVLSIKSIVFELRKSALEVKEREERLTQFAMDLAREKSEDEALLDSIADAIVATDREGKITTVNKAFELLLGWSSDEVIGMDMEDIVKLENDEGILVPKNRRPLSLAVTTGRKITEDLYMTRKNGTRFPALIRATPIMLNGEVIGAIKVFSDATKEKEIDRAKSEFISLASHQLRTPLSIAQWYLEAIGKLKNRRSLIEEKYFHEVESATRRMSSLVSNLLRVSRLEIGTFVADSRPFSPRKIIERLVDELDPKIQARKLVIKKEYKDPHITLVGDVDLFALALGNILSNAIYYTPEGGRITLEIRKNNSEGIVSVTDTGYGIPADEQGKIFTKFFRADNIQQFDTEGTGLGLYIAKSVVELSGGQIWFQSQENRGSVFFLSMPARITQKINTLV